MQQDEGRLCGECYLIEIRMVSTENVSIWSRKLIADIFHFLESSDSITGIYKLKEQVHN